MPLRKLDGVKRKVRGQQIPFTLGVRRLRITARRTIPLFRRIANNRVYAERILQAIRALDLDRLIAIIRETVPGASASVGAGFDACLNFNNPVTTFCIGIFRPGQSVFLNDIRAISRIMLPLLRRIANNRNFAARVYRLFLQRRSAALLRLVRTVVNPRRARSVSIDDFGFAVVVQLPNGRRYNFVFTILV